MGFLVECYRLGRPTNDISRLAAKFDILKQETVKISEELTKRTYHLLLYAKL